VLHAEAGLAPIAQCLERLGLEMVRRDKLTSPEPHTVSVVQLDALDGVGRKQLLTLLAAGSPLVMTIGRRLGPDFAWVLERGGLCHLAAETREGLVHPFDFELTLRRLGGQAGPHAYLSPNAVNQSYCVTGSRDKNAVVDSIGQHTLRAGGTQRLADVLRTVADELLTNALYNAPIDTLGRHRFAQLGRDVCVELSPDEEINVTFSADDSRIGVAVSDSFGSLTPDRLRAAVARCLKEGAVERKAGGAGLGLFNVLNSMSHLVATLEPGRRTEMLALVETSLRYRELMLKPCSFDCFVGAR
jgi:hypothetical protein